VVRLAMVHYHSPAEAANGLRGTLLDGELAQRYLCHASTRHLYYEHAVGVGLLVRLLGDDRLSGHVDRDQRRGDQSQVQIPPHSSILPFVLMRSPLSQNRRAWSARGS